jgi:hypothetical protein
MEAQCRRVKPIKPARPVKINYPEDVVLRSARSTGCRRMAPVKRSEQDAVFVDDLQ